MASAYKDVFDALREIMLSVCGDLDIKHDKPGNLYVDTHYTNGKNQGQWFGGVQTKKNYVSYHLMPVYVNPSLLASVSPALKKRMQGKSCFNFNSIDDKLFAELNALTERALHDFGVRGLLRN